MALSFFGGMAEGFGQSLDDHAKFVRDHRAKTRDFLQTYGTQAVLKAKDEANKVIGIGARLEALNFEPEDLTYLVDTSGPAALATLYEKVKGFESDPSKLTSDVVKQMMQRTKDYKPSGTSYQDMVTKAFGLYAANVTDNPVENESNAFLAAMGLDPKAGGGETYIDNYTESDIRRIAGTPAPSLTSPLSVDFGALPKIHSPQALRAYATDTLLRIEREAEVALSGLYEGSKELTDLAKGDNASLYNSLAAAIKEDNYELMVKLVPSIGNGLLEFNDLTRGGLSNNAFFLQSVPNFFSSETTKREIGGTTSAIEAEYSKAYAIYPNMPALADINTYKTEEEAGKSGDAFFILEGKLTRNKDHPSFVTDRRMEVVDVPTKLAPGDVLNIKLSGGADLDNNITVLKDGLIIIPKLPPIDTTGKTASEVEQTILELLELGDEERGTKSTASVMMGSGTKAPKSAGVENEPTDLTEQMLSLDVPDTVKGNPTLSNWDALSTNALSDLDREQKNDVTTNREVKKADTLALSSALDSVKEYLEADAKGLSNEALEAKALEMTSKIMTVPEDVQAIVMGLIQDLEDGKMPEEKESYVDKGIDFLKNLVSRKEEDEPVLATNDPADVVAMGKIPYTELRSTQAVPDAIKFNSFDSLKNELKLGNLKDGDVVEFRTEYFVVNQQGLSGPIGKVDLIRN